MGMSLMGAEPVQITDAVDSSKTAADGVVVSPAGISAFVNKSFKNKVCMFNTGENGFDIKFTTISNERSYFLVFVISQSCQIVGVGIEINVSSGQFQYGTFQSYGGLGINSAYLKTGDPHTVHIGLNSDWTYGVAYVFPSWDITILNSI